ncbi:alpha/beta hydrolase [Mucilaginibacter sp.]
MRKILNINLLLILVLATQLTYAQKTAGRRYKDLIFTGITVDKDQSYSADGVSDKDKTYQYDFYQPEGDDAAKRPLVIWMHGGGFKFGSKADKDVTLWSQTFAQRGYVCASINYTLNKSLSFNYAGTKKNCYVAIENLKQAIAYFKANAARYRIDTSRIILGGNSAGGMTALQAAYCNPADLIKLGQETTPGIRPEGRVKALAVINFWGALFDINYLQNARVPIVSAHGSEDGNVPFTQKVDENGGIYGSKAIQQKATALKIPNNLKVFQGYAHQLQKHFNPLFGYSKDTQERWAEAGQFAADFIYPYVASAK